jgi:ketosteroid isomerase-like protein
MSRENVEKVRRAWEAGQQGDLEAGLDVFGPDVEMDLSQGGRVDAGVYYGREAVRRAAQDWFSAWASMAMEPTEFIDLSDDALVVRVEARGRSRQTGMEVELEFYWLYTMREGLAVRVREFATRQEALEAVGLRE